MSRTDQRGFLHKAGRVIKHFLYALMNKSMPPMELRKVPGEDWLHNNYADVLT